MSPSLSRLRAAVEPVAERLGAPVIWVAGNHDERPALRGECSTGPTEEPVTGVWDLGGLRLIALDTTVPGWHHGDLDDEQLAWLSEVLADARAARARSWRCIIRRCRRTSRCSTSWSCAIRAGWPRSIAGTDVRAILAGHLHYSTSGTFAGVPVSVAAATCYTMNLARPAVEVNGMDAGQSFHLVHVYDDTITHAVVPVMDAPTGEYFSAAWVRADGGAQPAERLEAFSRKPGR